MFPKLIMTESGTAAVTSDRIPLASGERNEAWLRDLLLRHPEALPAVEIDKAFADPIPVCRELSTPAGPIDAVFINRHGARAPDRRRRLTTNWRQAALPWADSRIRHLIA